MLTILQINLIIFSTNIWNP